MTKRKPTAKKAAKKKVPGKATKKKPAGRPKIPEPTQKLLWGCTAGRCEFRGCHKPLWKAPTTLQQVNISEVAHIIAFSVLGPRGEKTLSPLLAKDLSNLMLLCDACHKLIDERPSDYEVELLRAMKREHEEWIRIVTSGAPDLKSHVLFYGENIGDHGSMLSPKEALAAMLPHRHPSDDHGIAIGLINSSSKDSDPDFWRDRARELQTKYEQLVRPRINTGAVRHISVFARAPQPLLMLLGSLLGDISDIEVYQRRKEPPSWKWEEKPDALAFSISAPSSKKKGDAALVFGLSATVTDDRITSVVGDDVPIWRVSIPTPDNDFVRSRAQTKAFRQTMRPILDQIKAAHGEKAVIHVFPAMPVSLAVDFGRVLNAKSDLPLIIYDENKALGGFVKALEINPRVRPQPIT
jgi:hypothetical protein